MDSATLIALGLYFLGMLVIGVYAAREASGDAAAFLLGGRRLGPAVTALSAGASDMSAWIMMGLPGAMVVTGISSAWIAIGLFIGAWCNYRLVAPRLRVFTELAGDALTLPDYFTQRFQDHGHWLRIFSAVVIIVFFTLYTSSGLVAGGLLFEASFGMGYSAGVMITLAVVVAYTLLGGFHAVCLTDFVQGCIILVALLAVPLAAFVAVGGPVVAVNTVAVAQAGYFDMLRGLSFTAIFSSLAWGLGYFGQPHIVVRFMAIRSHHDLGSARRIGMSWMGLALAGALLTGFSGLGVSLSQGVALENPETVFMIMAQWLFHPLVAGFLLAAILAAIMSTISSQLLVSSSSLSEDFYKVFVRPAASGRELVLVSRVAVLGVAGLAWLLARQPDSSVLTLVSHAWAGFGAAFGPVIVLSLFWPGMNRHGALAGMLVGSLTVLLWVYAPLEIGGEPLSSWLYEIVPGVVGSTVTIWLVSRCTGGASQAVRGQYQHMDGHL